MTVVNYEVTAELRSAVQRSLELLPLTQDDIRDRGGPSSTTLTNLFNGSLRTVKRSTLKKFGDAFGWRDGLEFELVSAEPSQRAGALADLAVGHPREKTNVHTARVVGSAGEVDRIFAAWSRHTLAALNLEHEFSELRDVDPFEARAQMWEALLSQPAAGTTRPFTPAWREGEPTDEADDAWDDEDAPSADDVGPDEYDYDQIAARRTTQVPVEQQIEHIDPVAEDGDPGED